MYCVEYVAFDIILVYYASVFSIIKKKALIKLTIAYPGNYTNLIKLDN